MRVGKLDGGRRGRGFGKIWEIAMLGVGGWGILRFWKVWGDMRGDFDCFPKEVKLTTQ
jgi:hypothetical protein